MNVKGIASGLVVVGALLVTTAAAQAQTRAVDAHFFRPALFSGGIFAVDRGHSPTQWQPGFKFFFNHEAAPLRLSFPHDKKNLKGSPTVLGEQEIVDNAQVFNLQFQIAILRWLELGIDVPFVRHSMVSNPAEDTDEGFELLVRSDKTTTITPSDVSPMDARVGLKFNILDTSGFGLALALETTLPFGDEEVFAGDKGFTVRPQLLASFDKGNFGAAINLGYRIREKSMILWDDFRNDEDPVVDKVYPLLGVDDELTFGAGAVYQFHKFVGVGAEVIGAVPLGLGSFDVVYTSIDYTSGKPVEKTEKEQVDVPGTTVMEVLGGVIINPTEGLNIALGGGAGVLGDERKTTFRLFLGMSWLPGAEAAVVGVKDRDRDGVTDAKDSCPDKAEDKDGFQDDDGCPELDNDQDGVPDSTDQCKEEAEDKDGYQDEDGCPDLDNDGDGVPDTQDSCPDKPEDKDKFQDSDGCPETDNDGDGIADARDNCPNEPETVNNFQDEDGCPDSVPTGVAIKAGKIEIPDKILFIRGSAVIARQSYKLLNDIATKIRENPQAGKIRIEGHCDSTGTKDANQKLSQGRAESVRRYIMGKGVSGGRLQAVGYGSERSVATNTTAEGRAKNRRVEFIIIKAKTP